MSASPMSPGQRSLAGFRSPMGADVAFGMLEAAQTVTEAQQQGYGWVTLAADGIATVTRKVTRLPAAVRQQHIQHWTRRVAVDSERERDRALIRDKLEDEKVRDKFEDEKKADAKAGERTPGLAPLASQQGKARTERARSPPRGAAVSSAYLNDIESDPKGIGFAFGGVYPGRLHARGRVVDEHKVNYSVGVVGSYLLHVRLRQPHAETTTIALQDSLPGSPFTLKVVAGSAHPLSTQLPWPLVGEHERERGVFACELVLVARDKMGNRCDRGGAQVVCGFMNVPSPVAVAEAEKGAGDESAATVLRQQGRCEDRGDGTYVLEWESSEAGFFDVFVKVDGLHVLGSPTQLELPPLPEQTGGEQDGSEKKMEPPPPQPPPKTAADSRMGRHQPARQHQQAAARQLSAESFTRRASPTLPPADRRPSPPPASPPPASAGRDVLRDSRERSDSRELPNPTLRVPEPNDSSSQPMDCSTEPPG